MWGLSPIAACGFAALPRLSSDPEMEVARVVGDLDVADVRFGIVGPGLVAERVGMSSRVGRRGEADDDRREEPTRSVDVRR